MKIPNLITQQKKFGTEIFRTKNNLLKSKPKILQKPGFKQFFLTLTYFDQKVVTLVRHFNGDLKTINGAKQNPNKAKPK